MNENFIFYASIAVVVVVFLMFFRPVREFILGALGAKSFWGGVWMVIVEIYVAHKTWLLNFRLRSVVYPTLEKDRYTNAED